MGGGGFLSQNLGQGEFGFQNSSLNRSVLKHWLHVAAKLGANALLLHPLCPSSWFCRQGAHGPPFFERYSAEAIRVQGSLCTIPFQCWSTQAIVTEAQQLRRARHEEAVHITSFRRAFGLSIGVGLPTRMTLKDRSRILQSSPQGHLRCPRRLLLGGSYFPPILPTFASARVDAQGRVKTKQLIIFRIGGIMATDWMMADFLRHWRFQGRGIHPHRVHLLMDWHLVPLHKGQPIPPGVVCAYPVYPKSGWSRGKMIRHLRWPVYTFSEGGKKERFAANPVRAR